MGKQTSAIKKVAEGLGIAALAAGAAAAYYFSGPKGKKRRKAASAWSKKAKTEMVQKIRQMEGLSKKAYEKAAKEVLAKYKQAKNIDSKELSQLGHELKGHWAKISKSVSALGGKKTAAKKKGAK